MNKWLTTANVQDGLYMKDHEYEVPGDSKECDQNVWYNIQGTMNIWGHVIFVLLQTQIIYNVKFLISDIPS